MRQDIRDLFREEVVEYEEMPHEHELRFLQKLDEAFPDKKRFAFRFSFSKIAASVLLLLGLSFGAYSYFQSPEAAASQVVESQEKPLEVKTLGDISPDLKKVEDYYLASINLELSKIKSGPETKEVLDGYLEQLNALNQEYEKLSLELTENGPTELTVNALIDNLRFRLNLLYRLRNQLKTLEGASNKSNEGALT